MKLGDGRSFEDPCCAPWRSRSPRSNPVPPSSFLLVSGASWYSWCPYWCSLVCCLSPVLSVGLAGEPPVDWWLLEMSGAMRGLDSGTPVYFLGGQLWQTNFLGHAVVQSLSDAQSSRWTLHLKDRMTSPVATAGGLGHCWRGVR